MDVTSRRHIEAQLQAHNEELDSFAHTVAHDLKNPLQLLIGYTELLEESTSAEEWGESAALLPTMVRTSNKMDSIIEELLLLAGVRKAKVEPQPLDMTGLVLGAQLRLTNLIEEYRAEIVVPEAWPAALGHGPWVEEVWTNYLSNAIKYGGRPPRVELGAQEANGMVCFWVRDNGDGIDPQDWSRLFVPFSQLSQVRAEGRGHGLGLSIVRRIVEKLGGEVGVESSGMPGQGSTFYFTLPQFVLKRSIQPGCER
jgi:signal transduction histidine kinase